MKVLEIIKQGAYLCHVERINKNTAITSVNYIATDFDAFASIVFDVRSYEILDAKWEIHRAPNPERCGEGDATMLIGESVCVEDNRLSVKVLPDYSQKGKGQQREFSESAPGKGNVDSQNFAKGLTSEVSPEWRRMRRIFMEAVRGAFQVEPLLARERGLGGSEGFQEYWIQGREGYCRPYNPPEGQKKLTAWPERDNPLLQQGIPKDNLYKKYIQFTIFDLGEGAHQAVGHYNDNGHEMSASFTFGADDGIITEMNTRVKRVPFKVCRGIEDYHTEELIGKNIYELKKGDVGRTIGGPWGCFHMVDVVNGIVEGVQGVK